MPACPPCHLRRRLLTRRAWILTVLAEFVQLVKKIADMEIRIDKYIKLPFRLLPVMKMTAPNKLEVKINVKANFSQKVTGSTPAAAGTLLSDRGFCVALVRAADVQ